MDRFLNWIVINKIAAIITLLGVIAIPIAIIYYIDMFQKLYASVFRFKHFNKLEINVSSDSFVRDNIKNYNIEWRKNYRLYYLNVTNSNKDFTIEDLRLDIYTPVGLLSADIYRQSGCQNLMLQCEDHLKERGEITKRDKNEVTGTFTFLKNEVLISGLKLSPNASFIIRFVLVYPEKTFTPDGYLNTKYTYSNAYNKKKSITEYFKLDSSSDNSRILSISKNEGKNKWAVVFQPTKPLIFKKDGSISQQK